MDDQAFAHLIEPHRRALHLHCYRRLDSLHDADDALQETMLRAWKSSDRYEPRAQLTTWLHAIATNVCLTAIARRRARPVEAIEDLEHLQPYPDRLLDDLVVRETVELAFITAIQLLPPKQRAVLILRDVLGWSAKEVATALGDSVGAVTSALQRARSGLEGARRRISTPDERERQAPAVRSHGPGNRGSADLGHLRLPRPLALRTVRAPWRAGLDLSPDLCTRARMGAR